jgi:glycosyltransferase involved in cell wall biosynthesis
MRCVLVGDGSQRGYLSALAKRLGIDHLVHFAGTQTNPYRFMSKAAVFVLPSLSEGMPNVLLEAMACGCPVVASDIEGGVTRELLDDGACGLIVPPGDSSAIESAILRIVGDDSLRDRLISRGLEHVRRFDLPLTMTESQELFLAVANASVVREGEQASLERNVNPTVTPHSTGDARTVLRPAAQRSAAQSGQPALGSFVARPIRRGVSLAAGAFAVLRRHGVKAVTARAMHKVRIALPLRAALHARTAGGRPREGTIQPRQSDRTQLILLVPHLDDSTIGPEAAAVLRHIDRELYDVSLVRIYPGHDTVDVPTDVVQYVVQADGGSVEVESGKLPQDIRASYSRELEWMASLAQGLAVLARQVHADVILAHGFLATNVAMLARDSLSPSTAIVSAMRSYAGDFEGSSGSARLHGALVRGYLSDADAVVVPNERIERDLISKLGVSAANVSVSPDPVEVPDQALVPAAIEVPVEWLQQPGPVFVCVEEPGFSSGMDVFLESVALARGHEDVRCAVLASAGTVRRMKDVAVRLGIDGVVRFVSEPGVARAVLARAFAYVCPCSQLGSGLPHALLAAVEEGRPVLSTRCSDAVAQFLGEGERGVLVPRGDAEALAEAMLQLVWDEEFTQRAVSRASEHLRTVSAENVVARLEGVIAACLRARQRAEGPE